MTAAVDADRDVEPTPEAVAAAGDCAAADRWHDLGMEAGLVGPEVPRTVTFDEAG